MAVLALNALARETARLPLAIRVLEGLAVQRGPVGAELVTAAAERRRQERGRAGDAAVRKRLARRRARQRAVAAWRTEALMGAHVAACAGQALAMKRSVEGGIGNEATVVEREGRLFGQRRVTAETAERGGGIALEHLDELAGDAGPRRRRVPARAPVRILRGMAGAARLRPERRLDRREAGGRRALRLERRAPVATHELLDTFAATGRRRDDDHGHDRRERSHGTR